MYSSRTIHIRHALALAFGVLALLSASYLWLLQDSLGPQRQRINVRYAQNVPAQTRQEFEQQRGLAAGEEKGARTWNYLVTDQSQGNIGALLQSPLVEDTAHIDRNRLRVELDLPDMPPWVRELLQRGWLLYGSWLLAAAGFVLAWTSRRGLAHWIRMVVREVPRRLEATGGRLQAIAGRFDTLSASQEILLCLAFCAVFLAPMLLYGPTDDEELALGTFSSQIYYRDLLHGRWAFWLTNLGFGTPMPLGHRLDFHPVFALGSLISLRVALSGLWIVQVVVMALYSFRLLSFFALTPAVRLVFLALQVFSLPSYLYFFDTDWVSCQVPWTLYPVLVYYVRDAVMGGAATRWWLTTVRLGVLFSLWVLNAHPGYLVPLFMVFAVYTLAAARPTLAVYGALGTAGLFALAASAERIYFLAHEMGLFPADVLRLSQDGYSALNYLASQAAPLTKLGDARHPFVGAFVLGAALAAPLVWRTVDRHVRACIIAFFVALVMSMLPVRSIRWTGISAVWLFRDPMVFFGLLSAAAVVQSASRAHTRSVRQIMLVLVALQGLQQVIVFWPGYRDQLAGPNRLGFYQHQGNPIGLAAAVVNASKRYGSRLYLSPQADAFSRGYLAPAGVYVATDYALLGLNPVNAWFKNVAMDRIYPSWVLMHGVIRGQRAVVENATLLDVLGINLVVAITEEGLAPAGLKPVEHVRMNATGVDILANPDAWPKAVLLSPEARAAALPLVEGCEHTAALCRDYTALARTRLPQDVTLSEAGDGYRVHVPPSDRPRLLFVSAFYRPEWLATAGVRPLVIEPIADAFISVTVPPGVQDIELAYRPRTRIALAWLSGLSVVALLIALGAISWHRRTRRSVIA